MTDNDYTFYALNLAFAKIMYILSSRYGSIEITTGNQTIELSASEATALEQYLINSQNPLYTNYNEVIKALCSSIKDAAE